MKNLFVRFVREDGGQDLIEYTLLAALISIISIATVGPARHRHWPELGPYIEGQLPAPAFSAEQSHGAGLRGSLSLELTGECSRDFPCRRLRLRTWSSMGFSLRTHRDHRYRRLAADH